MSRRKFTMLEAFQVSAKESADRAAEERRRLVLEREKEIRREESHRAAEDLRKRVGGGVGAWISGVLGDDEDPAPAHERDTGPEGPSGEPADPGLHGDSAERTGDPTSAVPIDRSPPSVFDFGADGSSSSDVDPAGPEALQSDESPSVETQTGSDSATRGAPDAPPAEEPSPGAAAASASENDLPSSLEASPKAGGVSLAGPSIESAALPAEPALETAAEPALGVAVPMSAKGFTGLLVLLAAGVFAIGYGLGRRAESPNPAETPQGGPASGADLGSFASPPARSASPGLPSFGEGLAASEGPSTPSAAISPPADTSPASTEPPTEPATGATDADRAFMDPKMRFTVLAITYPNSPDRQAMAWDTYDLLAAEGLPVVRPAVKDSRIHVLVGASARLAELDNLVTKIRSLRVGRSGRNEFRSAYKVNIEDFR